jgi:hypothetical protein
MLFPGLPPYRVTIDRLGLRVTKPIEAAKTPGTYRILCVGDSVTFGLFVNDEDSYPYLLQQRLDASGRRVEVLNAGIGGVTIPDEAYYLEHVGLRLEPDLVILSFCGNDFAEMSKRPEPFYEHLQREAERDPLEALVWSVKRTHLYRLFGMAEVHYKYFGFLCKLSDPAIKRVYRERRRDHESLLMSALHQAEPLVLRPMIRNWPLHGTVSFRISIGCSMNCSVVTLTCCGCCTRIILQYLTRAMHGIWSA